MAGPLAAKVAMRKTPAQQPGARTVARNGEASLTMDAAILMINDQRISLSDDADMSALITDVMTAVIDGGGFVHIDGQRGEEYDVLVTPATQIIVRYRTMSFESGTTLGPWTAGIDLEL